MEETIKVILEIDKETFNRIKGYVEIDHFDHDIVGYTMKRLVDGTIISDKPSGEWLGIDYDGYADGQPVIELWECSNCGYEHTGDYTTLTDYCPHCGAKMVGKEQTDGTENNI